MPERKSKARLDMRVTIHFSFNTPTSGPPPFFPVQFNDERANFLSNKYRFNLGRTAQYFPPSCIGFGTL